MYGDNEPGGNATKYYILIPLGNEKEYCFLLFYKRIFNTVFSINKPWEGDDNQYNIFKKLIQKSPGE